MIFDWIVGLSLTALHLCPGCGAASPGPRFARPEDKLHEVERCTAESGTATDWDDPGSAAHHFASLVLRCARDTLLKLTPMRRSGPIKVSYKIRSTQAACKFEIG